MRSTVVPVKRILRPDLRVLLASGYAEEILKQQGADQDDFEVLSKPYPQAQLLRHVAESVERMQGIRAASVGAP